LAVSLLGDKVVAEGWRRGIRIHDLSGKQEYGLCVRLERDRVAEKEFGGVMPPPYVVCVVGKEETESAEKSS